MKTYSLKSSDVQRKWYVIDASKTSLGRVATTAASLLIGKGKPTITSHIDGGDYVVLVNAKKVILTGNKLDTKVYYRHSGYPGAIKQKTLREAMQASPSEVITMAVRGMLPVNKLRPGRLARLKVYDGAKHDHEAQQPEIFEIKAGK